MSRYPEIEGIEIDAELGRGAHSVVYSGRHHGVPCAVKLPRERARWSKWIYREAVSLARVKHALLPEVFEVGEIDGLPYLVMELVEGGTLAEKIAAGPIDEETAARLAGQLASALAAVHEAGLVHRDVKPQNIIVDLPRSGFRLVDFGFATPMERVGASETAGTAAYAAPEQLVPPGNVDARADLFGVGRVLYEALVGVGALRGPEPAPCGAEARDALVSRGVSRGLAELIGHLLERSPENRYPNAHAVSAELERLLRGLPLVGPHAYVHRNEARPLIGRLLELERILGACRDLRGSGAVVLVRGARGSGKTRLLRTVSARVGAFGATISLACREQDAPLSTLRRILASYWGDQIDAGSTESLRTTIEDLAPVVRLLAPQAMLTALQWSVSSPSSLVGGEVTTPADSLVEGAAELLLRLAGRGGPLVIVIDDAQWMDPASADALARLAHRVSEAAVALVIAARPTTDGPMARFSALRASRTTEVSLPSLTEDDVGDLVSFYLGDAKPDATLVARIHAMAGGTPLGVREVLDAFLDYGALRPHHRSWRFDPSRAVTLPRGALVLLGHRLAELPAATLRVLELAAIFGTSFEDETLQQALELTAEELGFALISAQRSGLIEPDERGKHRFVHDSLRERLVDELSESARQRHHQCAAEVLDARPSPTFEELCATALHYAAGVTTKDPARAYRVARAAGEAAVARFDNETALRFLGQARRFANTASIALDAGFFRSVGEAHLRVGSLDESLGAFEAALDRAKDGHERAEILGRLSWVYQTRAEPEHALDRLERAFAAVGHRLPDDDVVSAARTSTHIARARIGRLLRRPSTRTAAEIDLLCQLHYQNARLGLEYGKPARLIQSGLESLELSERGGSAAMRARARAFYAVVLTAFGQKAAGGRNVAAAKEIATREGNPATLAFAVQLHFLVTSFAGELDESLLILRECTQVHGPWLEISEFLQNVSSGELMETLRGRSAEAWQWMERALERLRRTNKRPAMTDVIIHRARAALAAVGKTVREDDSWLSGEFEALSPRDAGQGFHRLISWGPRARYYLETGELGDEFEELIRSFQVEGHVPGRGHIALGEYYAIVAHARIHQTLRARASERAERLPALRRAVADLEASAKIALSKAHLFVAEAYLAWFEDRVRAANKRLDDAVAIANAQGCPWVLYAVARLRAHMLRAQGKHGPALDQARVARLFAHEHGAVTRVRWISEEFGLNDAAQRPTQVVSNRGSSSTSRAHRQLTTLLQVVRAPRRDLKIEQQAAAILDELLESLGADRGAIWFQPERSTRGTMVARRRDRDVAEPLDADRDALLRSVHETGAPWPALDGETLPTIDAHRRFDAARVLAVPLFLYEKPVGALSIERRRPSPSFELDEQNLLHLLSHQVPIALEIARLLSEREQLHATLQHAKKMEAMGTLAGGLAHDFNNMLGAMRVALTAVQERAAFDAELMTDLDVIGQATSRAAQLTSQLLSFSRHQPVPASVHSLNDLVRALEPMLQRIVGKAIRIDVSLSASSDTVEVDQGSLDQALVNLVLNARDAMPTGGTIAITTQNVHLGENAARNANVPPGDYVELGIADTGQGMSTETQSRIFEPFFTTKGAGRGNGLGLPMVYAFARNSSGSVQVESELGKGTTFRLYLRRVDRPVAHRNAKSSGPQPAASSAERNPDARDTILVVDDDDLVRRSIARTLERSGYRVVAASGSTEALDVAREQGPRIGLVILDVLMPGLTGPELGQRLTDLNLPAKLLFVSGFSPESIPLEGPAVAPHMLLQKPFSQTTLLERVRKLMHP